MGDVVLANNRDIKSIFKETVLLSLFCYVRLYFFLLLNYQIIAPEKKSAVCVEKSFLSIVMS